MHRLAVAPSRWLGPISAPELKQLCARQRRVADRDAVCQVLLSAGRAVHPGRLGGVESRHGDAGGSGVVHAASEAGPEWRRMPQHGLGDLLGTAAGGRAATRSCPRARW
jgi:hypothetical protein